MPRLGIWVVLILSLVVLSGCTPIGQAVRDVQRAALKPTCSLGTELRVSVINGLPRTCWNDQLDILEVAVEALDRSIIGIKIEVIGENDTINLSYIPSKKPVVIRYEIPQITKKVGRMKFLTIYPIVEMEGEQILCEAHPLKVEFDFC